jgi:exodeoxyribonuclease VII large subunit
MAKPLKSQWEFGELFPAEAVRKVLTVSELTGSIRRLLEKEIGSVSVMGEITNLRVQASGHIYFTIKDANSQVSCVLFRNESRTVNREYLEDGQKVVIEGEVTVYEARGQYQLRVFSVQLQGLGALQAAFERLKQKLQAEGLFDSGHKRPLPPFPQRIGIVTSVDGAAIRDVLHAIERRNPSLELVLSPCRVQGPGAAQEIAAAINMLNEWASASGGEGEPRLSLILVTRGGGSLEDLWAFNEEIVARAIYASKLPVISAVGHEIDFTIGDFVADFRAATPTAAAEIVTEGIFSARTFIAEAHAHIRELLEDGLAQKKEYLGATLRRLHRLHPQRRLQEQSQRLDDLQLSLRRCARTQFRQKQADWQALHARFVRLHPETQLARRRELLVRLVEQLHTEIAAAFQRIQQRFTQTTTRLELLSPANILKRGYSITTDSATGRVLRDAQEAKAGAKIRTRLARGEIRSTVDPKNDVPPQSPVRSTTAGPANETAPLHRRDRR